MLVPALRRIGLVLAALLALSGAAFAQDGDVPLIVFGDMVIGHVNVEENRTCTLNNRYLPGQMVVWRVEVVDPSTGEEMNAEQLSEVELQLADGQTFEMHYGEHPPEEPTDAYWTASWTIPEDYPTGVVDYTVVATGEDGRVGELNKFPIETSTLTVVASE